MSRFTWIWIALAVGLGGCSQYPLPPETRTAAVTDVLHGVEFVDDYRWLEAQESAETRSWIAAQNAYAESIIGDSPLRDSFRRRLRELIDRDDVGSTRKAGEYEYFTMRRRGEEAPILYRRPAPADPDDSGDDNDDSEPTVDGEYEVVLDPADFDPGYRTLIATLDFSPDGNLLLYSVRQGGADEIEVRVRDLEAGRDLADRLPDALYSGVEFDDAGTGFYYTHRSRRTGPRIRHHTLGEEPTSDVEIWGAGYPPTTFIGMDRIDKGRYTIFTVQHGWARNDLFLRRGDGPVQPVVEGVEAHFQHRFRDGTIYIRTDWKAPNYRLMAADPRDPAPESWKELIPAGDDVFESYSFIDDRIYAVYLHDVAHRVRVFDLDGAPLGEIAVPDNASVSLRSGEGDKTARLGVRAHFTPPTTFDLDLETGERSLASPPEIEIEAADFEVTKLRYLSGGGREAPIYVLHRAGLEFDGSHPTILSGYGGFNSSTRPGFSATRLAWVEAGGVYAVATLRGGAEYGEAWHRDGMLENKQNVFDDFIAASEALIAAGVTTPERLGISGGSNGGLLVAAAMTQRPDLYRAVLCTYPDLDMVRFYEFDDTNNLPALLEYGDARIPSQFEAIRRYSPYQAVRDGVHYPAVMLTTGDLDTRVPPLQARKMTARLQAATRSGLPVILWYDERGGHAGGRGRPLSLRIEDSARELTFMGQQLGIGSVAWP